MKKSFAISESNENNISKILFKNATIFDGKNETLLNGMNVLVENNIITKISNTSIEENNTEIIDVSGMTLMPGMIDAHTHLSFTNTPQIMESSNDLGRHSHSFNC